MFGLLAVLNSLVPSQREGHEALIYENYIRTGEGVRLNKIYRESSADKRVRKELATIRYKERLQQQVKFVRLMKKLLIKADHEKVNGEIDEELEQMRIKVTQFELKVEKAACAKDINCEDMFNMDKPNDPYDIELEQIIRTATSNIPPTEKFDLKATNKKLKHHDKASGDHVNIQTSNISNDNPHDFGDQLLIECIRKNK
jgi:hypothetical protein